MQVRAFVPNVLYDPSMTKLVFRPRNVTLNRLIGDMSTLTPSPKNV